ncbi:MAG: TraR/DksA family transcriptional regulator [Saprospiraceae bacterium]|nr:TraR/DksA family transcriptional regulator [Saprospiraceae bacterium]
MTAEEKEKLKEKIERSIEEFEEKIVALEANTQPISPENSIGRVSRMDAINNKSVAEAALRNAKRKLSKLQLALKSIDKSGFGLCDRCQQPIAPLRLMFLPESTRCIRCADK